MGVQIREAQADVDRRKAQLKKEHEQDQMAAAIDFLLLKDDDVRVLKRAWRSMDTKRRGYVRVADFFAACDITRSPLADAIFYFTDAEFKGKIDFGTFLRTVATFCMFGASDMLAWAYTVVGANLIAAAERGDKLYGKKSYKPGFKGVSGQIDGSEDKAIVLKFRTGEQAFTGYSYLTTFVLPNVYFHATTTYAILRHNGVELGKRDYLGA